MNFVRKIWEARLIDNYNEVSALPLIATAPTEMTASSIVFNRANAGTIKDYDGAISWESLDTTPVEMTFEFKKYFAFTVDDVDKAQTNIAIVDGLAKTQADLLSSAADAYAYSKYAAGAGNKVATTGTDEDDDTTYALPAVTISVAEDMYDAIVNIGTVLGNKKVPIAGRYVILGWDALALLEKDKRFTHNPDVLVNGIVSGQKINGMTLIVSANVPASTVIAVYQGAVGFGTQINELEAMRLQSAFADGVRGLDVAGAVVLNPDGVAAFTYTVSQ